MANSVKFFSSCLLLLSLTLPFFSGVHCRNDDSRLQTYIVHVEWPEGANFANLLRERDNWYTTFLPDTSRLIHSYGDAIRGFAAKLTEEELAAIEKMDGFLSAYPDQLLPLHTTNTPEFLGLKAQNSIWPNSSFGEGVIIGILDTGLTPDHPSFRGEAIPSPPSKWKGECRLPDGYCNNKLIGFRSFVEGKASYDLHGHGTHTASTAAGASVGDAGVLGNAKGTAVGMAPKAHIAMYQVCGQFGCRVSDIVAGMSAAVEDGVDVLSLSLGGPSVPFYTDPIAIGTFRAMQKRIFSSCSAGNSGPLPSTLSNEAPWVLTVAASATDRSIRATVRIGDGQEFDGETLYQPKNFSSSTMLPLVLPTGEDAILCYDGSLDKMDVKGKIVLCERGGFSGRVDKGGVVKEAGGAAMILVNQMRDGYSILADNHSLPASHLSYADGAKIKAYINSASRPVATIVFKGTVYDTPYSPAITSFSSRGPSQVTPNTLKPDITGPGVDILAAWPLVLDERPEASESSKHYSFNVISGTSMSAPHLAGIAALLRSEHPDWSPAAIKSAIMTTANVLDSDGQPITDERRLPASFFTMGAGHVNPNKASDPGLVYDINPKDYISFLCQLHYTDKQVATIVGHKVRCSKEKKIRVENLNYPSIAVTVMESETVTVTRTVTNVGPAMSVYKVKVEPPEGAVVVVKPETLRFSKVKQMLSFTVAFNKNSSVIIIPSSQGHLSWVSSEHVVRSPISVTFG